MAQTCRTTGGKGNIGMFIERDPKVCAAGLATAQPNEHIDNYFSCYTLQDEVDSLIRDAIKPPLNISLPPLNRKTKQDLRHAGLFTESARVINPLSKTKFQTLVEDIKNTVHSSYWKKPLGTISDPVPTLPEGINIYESTTGKKLPLADHLYDVVMPKNPITGDIPYWKRPEYQSSQNYTPAFNPNHIFGMKYKYGPSMKCCLTDDRVIAGTAAFMPMITEQAENQLRKPTLGLCSLTYNNNCNVPPGFAFGKINPPSNDSVPESLRNCDLIPGRDFFLKCLSSLNTLRKCISKKIDAPFFHTFYLKLKYKDKNKTGWLPKEIIYDLCATYYIRFNPKFIEPLLEIWNAFDGSQIEYKTFVHVINYREPTPELPKVPDLSDDCIDFRTTYNEMVKPHKVTDTRLRAGLPSGRYFDKDYPVTPKYCCKAHRFNLPQESDARSCLCLTIFTSCGISHRDMYAIRTSDVIRKVFEAVSGKFTDEQFNSIWEAAKKYHSQGLVSFATFRRALNELSLR